MKNDRTKRRARQPFSITLITMSGMLGVIWPARRRSYRHRP
jgi:hypothetical protein